MAIGRLRPFLEAVPAGALSAQLCRPYRDLQLPLNVDFVEEPSVLAPALGICGDVSEADSWLFASWGHDKIGATAYAKLDET